MGEGCKTETEITEFFRLKYLIMLSNQERFVPDGFGDNATEIESIISWLPIST